jgi:prevent-host-death family protein
MRHIKASEFKAKCLKLMDEVQATGEEIVVTKNGKPVAKVSRLAPTKKTKFLFGAGKGRIEIVGDLIKPLPVFWDFDRWPKDDSETEKSKRGNRTKAKHVAAR